ncbi:MAG: hypothetical protein JWP91_3860 [Fibrobacteres bacterium]|nr:hypothetical protein [Fibrobacterota bacterium]
MKNSSRILATLVGAAMLLQVQGCYGNFSLTRKVYNWNGTLGDKWINSVVMFALAIVPVYGACGFLDWVIFNPIQFWTGKNPVTLNAGEKDIQMVQWKGGEYRLTATTNRLDVQQIIDGKPGAPVSLVYDIRTQSWSAGNAKEQHRIIEMVSEDGRVADLVYPDGHKQRVELAQE